jgi:hypothetical protein
VGDEARTSAIAWAALGTVRRSVLSGGGVIAGGVGVGAGGGIGSALGSF